MGVCNSQPVTAVSVEQVERHREIEAQIKKDENAFSLKLLLLGPGESGKSTILKQLIIVHKNGFTKDEMQIRRLAIYSNVIQSLVTILQAMAEMDILIESDHQNDIDLVWATVELHNKNPQLKLSKKLALAIGRLWHDKGVQAAYERRNEFQLIDSAKYFIESADRIADDNYMPTTKDMLFSRAATVGVTEISFKAKGVTFRVFDVGGQRSERKKWIHCFDDVHGVLFIAAISEYDQKLREDQTTNRLEEAVSLFRSIVNSEYFVKSTMILFLNKTDLFAEKIERVSLNVLYPSYDGGLVYEAAMQFLTRTFESQQTAVRGRSVFIHHTCATDTDQVAKIVDSILAAILNNNVNRGGMA